MIFITGNPRTAESARPTEAFLMLARTSSMSRFRSIGCLISVLLLALSPTLLGAREGAAATGRIPGRAWFDRHLQSILESDPGDRESMCTSLTRIILQHLGTESTELRARLQEGGSGWSEVDVLVVGGGVHAAIFNGVYTGLAPGARVLTVEPEESLAKVFLGPGPMGRINSPEGARGSANLIPGAPLQLSDLSRDEYPTYETLGHVLLYAHYASRSRFLLGEGVARLEPDPAGYRATLTSGLELRARQVVVAIGLGLPTARTTDAATLRLIEEEISRPRIPGQVSGIQYFEDAVHLGKKTLDAGLMPLAPYSGKRVAVVGTGDGGNIFMEFLLGRAPDPAYAGAPVRVLPARIFWVGQDAPDLAGYRAATRERYHASMRDLYQREDIERVPPHLETIERDGTEGFRLTAGTGIERRSHVVDLVVLATGYANATRDLLTGLGRSLTLGPVHWTIPGTPGETRVAQRAIVGGMSQEVYVVGPAAGPLASPEELERSITRNPVSINVLAPRTEALARRLAGLPP